MGGGGNLCVNGDYINTDLKEDVRMELESCIECPFYLVPGHGSFIAQTALHSPGYPATVRGQNKRNTMQLSGVQRRGSAEQMINF